MLRALLLIDLRSRRGAQSLSIMLQLRSLGRGHWLHGSNACFRDARCVGTLIPVRGQLLLSFAPVEASAP